MSVFDLGRFGAAALVATGLAFATPASAATFKWANDGDANSMDPYTRSETFLLTFTQNIYDPLVRRDRNLKVEPALAQSWEQPDDKTWRFHLRHGVKFTGGEPFTADDVVFSYQRAVAPGSQINGYFQAVKDVQKIDDFTVDFHMNVPRPDLPRGDHRLGHHEPRPGARRTTRSRRPTSPRPPRTSRLATPTVPGPSSSAPANPTAAPRCATTPTGGTSRTAT